MSEQVIHRLQKIIEKPVARGQCQHVIAGLVVGDGDFEWSGACGRTFMGDTAEPVKTDTPFFLASVTKLFTATALLQLCEAGRMNLSDPLTRHLPERLTDRIHVFRGRDRSGELRIEHLVAQTSGLADYFREKPKEAESLFTELIKKGDLGWDVAWAVDRIRDGLHPRFAPADLSAPRGNGRAYYSDTNFQLLGAALESAAGQPLHAIFEKQIFEPLGMRDTYLFGFGPPPERPPASIRHRERRLELDGAMKSFWADGGLVSTLADSLRFLRAFRSGSLFRDLSTLRSMQNWNRIFFPFQYGYGLMRFRLPRIFSPLRTPPELIGHSGASGSFLFFSPDQDVCLCGTMDQTDAPARPFQMMLAMLEVLRRHALLPGRHSPSNL